MKIVKLSASSMLFITTLIVKNVTIAYDTGTSFIRDKNRIMLKIIAKRKSNKFVSDLRK